MGVGYGKSGSRCTKATISLKWGKLELDLYSHTQYVDSIAVMAKMYDLEFE